MKRVCTGCQKVLGYECDFCESLNVKPSRTEPQMINCGNCFRKFRADTNLMRVECMNCLTRDLKAKNYLATFTVPEGYLYKFQ